MIIAIGLIIPFLGTALGAACVYLLKDKMPDLVQRVLLGFASGVMVAASVWSLLVPAMDASEGLKELSFLPATIGFWIGILFLLAIDVLLPHMHINSDKPEGIPAKLQKGTMLTLAVTLHNLPEGMAVGIVIAASLSGKSEITVAGATALAIGIAIQNFPEGAIISMPLHSEGMSRGKACLYGIISGAVEPVAALVMIAAASYLVPTMPYLLSFAAGAMMYVVVEELIPEMSEGEHSNIGVVMFAFGFTLMMALDVALG